MSDIENKTWVLSRIESMIHDTINDFKTIGDKFEKLRADEREKIIGKRNNIFTIFGVLLTVILALYSTEKINDNLFLVLLFSNIIFGSIVFIVSNLFLKRTTSAFIFIENQIVEGTNQLSLLSGFINIQSMNRENLNIEFLNSFLFFCYYVGISEMMKIKKCYQMTSEMYFLSKFSKNTFILNDKNLKDTFELTIPKLETFKPHESIPKMWYDPAKKIIDEYIKNNIENKKEEI